MCEVVEIEKKMLHRKFRFVNSRQICRTTFIRFHKENKKGKIKRKYFKERLYKRWLCNFLISGGMSIVYIESGEVK
jgi:hypothetical protein